MEISLIFFLIPINFLTMSLTTEINNLEILLTLFDSPSVTNGLWYLSTLYPVDYDFSPLG
jgi:hypothetical protein